MNRDGSGREVFAEYGVEHTTSCGDFVIVSAMQHGTKHLLRMRLDGTETTNLASGNLYSPVCSASSGVVYYVDLNPPQRIMRVPINGGHAAEIVRIPGDGIVGDIDVSHDGKYLAFPWEQYSPTPTLQLSVVSAGSGTLMQSMKAPPGVYTEGMRWATADSGIQYLLTRGGVTNLWEQPLAGKSPKRITNFTSDQIFSFSWSIDHNRLLLARGKVTTDVVVFKNFR